MILQKFKAKVIKESENVRQFAGDIEETNKLLKNKYNLYKKISGNTSFISELSTSDNPIDGEKNGVIIARHLSWWFAIPYKKIYCIDEYNYEEKKYYISIIDNRLKCRYLKMFLSLVLTVLLVLPIMIAILFKILMNITRREK